MTRCLRVSLGFLEHCLDELQPASAAAVRLPHSVMPEGRTGSRALQSSVGALRLL